jgi:hypothetical protein
MRRLAVFALIVGCGPSIDFAEFPDALLDARCEYLHRCGVVAKPSDCRAFHDHLAIDNPSPQAAYDAGKLQFHPDTAQACLDAYASLPCDATEQDPDALDVCARAITGVLGIGEACAFDRECASENCDLAPCTSACCTGTCTAPTRLPGVGEPCTALCADDAYCGADDICHAPLPPGAACNFEPCVAGYYCKGQTATTSGTCSPYPHLGEPCETACAEVNATCYNGTCIEYALLGDACISDAQCSGYYQCSSMQCALMPTRGMGCSTACSDDSWCENGVCVAQKANGSTCLRNDECLTHFCQRVGTGGTCTDVPLCI